MRTDIFLWLFLIGLGCAAAGGDARKRMHRRLAAPGFRWNAGRPRRQVLTRARRSPAVTGDLLPLACDLLAACLETGVTSRRALELVVEALGRDSLNTPLPAVSSALRLGASAVQAWAEVPAELGWTEVARAFGQAENSGLALAGTLTRLADERRRTVRAWAAQATARAGVRMALPLGVCFLPAFLLVGVLPVIFGFAHSLWPR
ncbi:type II secretion system protein [Acidothermus cellulolyticus 11B]|uniref:Type II secretion system protein n=1 Tax=Acidothermus cellulolyticus (strain ATCC 43068 / DSM 8971 / 11B) TaxID=351607 RepID=A0LWE2_ACIC1|nr:type II secretion system protein [Acidothermus cellulolyticus 11B]